MIMDRRSAPIITLSLAKSKSPPSRRSLPRRAAISAASLTRFSRSAPEKPGVPRAMASRSTSGESGVLRVCTLRMPSRPFTSGRGTTMRRSKRPGRSSAGSRTSGRFVAAIRITPSFDSKPADRVDFVDEDDAGGVLLALLEQVAHPRGAHADEHLDEVGAGDGEERHAGFASDGAGEKRLARSGRAHQEDALGNAAAELGELLRVLEEGDDLLELLLRLVDSGHVGEGDLVVVLRKELRLALAEAHRLAAARLELAHEEDEEDAEDAERHPGDEELRPERLRILFLELQCHALLAHVLEELAVERRDGPELLPVFQLTLEDVSLDGGRRDVPPLDRRVELARVDLLRLGGPLAGEDRIEREKQQDQDCPEKEGLVRLSHLGSSSVLGSIVAEWDSGRRLEGNGPSGGFISGPRAKETDPRPQAPPGRNSCTQNTRPWASARSASPARSWRGMCAPIQRSATFLVRPPAGRKRSPGRCPRSVHGNGACVTSTSTPLPGVAATSSARGPQA